MRRWQQVWALWLEGWSLAQIARWLDISDSHAKASLETAQAMEARRLMRSQWERLAVAMAEVYPDEDRSNWIYRQMGVERNGDDDGNDPG